jgi:hypothetical protein
MKQKISETLPVPWYEGFSEVATELCRLKGLGPVSR